jgi:hypothetical protein
MNELLGIRIVEQEREALDGFVGKAATAGLFPGEVLVKKIYFVTGTRELLAAHCAGGPSANDCNFGHSVLSLYRSRAQSDAQHASGPVMKEIRERAFEERHPLGDGEDHQAKTSEEYSTEYGCRQGRACFLVHNVHPPALQREQ